MSRIEPKNPPEVPKFRFLLFNKPMNVLTRFTDERGRVTLADFIEVPDVYPVGRLDQNSEGLLALTDRGTLVEPLLSPGKKQKRYLVAVEGNPSETQLRELSAGPVLKDGPTLPVQVESLPGEPGWLWPRQPPIRFRKSIPVSWLVLTLREGRNRQVRRMTAAVGLPTLRLVRLGFAGFELEDLGPGEWREASDAEKRRLLSLETSKAKKRAKSARSSRKRKRTRSRPGPRS